MAKTARFSNPTGSAAATADRRRFLRAAGAGALGAAAALALPAVTRAQAAKIVEMNNALRYVPDRITVKAGDTVEWRNVESYPHTVTADPKLVLNRNNVELPAGAKPFDSGAIRAGQTFRHTFDKPGVYRYVCLPHEQAGMLGTVIVK